MGFFYSLPHASGGNPIIMKRSVVALNSSPREWG